MIRDVMMNNEEIDRELGRVIEKHYKWLLKEIKTKIAKDAMREYGPELLHFVIIELYNKSPEYKQQLLSDEKVQYWLLTSSGLQLRSGSSPFYRMIRSNRMSARSGGEEMDTVVWEDYDGEMYECFLQAMDQLDFYQRKLVEEKYLNELTFKAISDKYQIHQNHIRKDLFAAIQQMREHCKHV